MAEQGHSRGGPRLEQVLRPVSELRPHAQAGLIPPMSAAVFANLRDDIAERGVLVPLEVTAAGVVLDGHERLRAARELALAKLPVRVVAPLDEVEYRLGAALTRRDLTPSQKAALVIERHSYQRDREQAQRRQLANLRNRLEVATLPPRQGRSRENAAAAAGVSARVVQDAITVHDADPVLFERVKAGEVAASKAAQQIRRARRYAEIGPAPPLPEGPFELIYADPPWQLGNPASPYAPEQHYPTMTLEQIKALEVPAAEDALLFLWVPSSLLPSALEVIEAWGFEYRTELVWVKNWIGQGQWVRNRHEPLLLARRGGFPLADPEDRPDSVIEAPRQAHSEKPSCVYDLIERMYPAASKLELFARGKPHPGWVGWGNEAEAA